MATKDEDRKPIADNLRWGIKAGLLCAAGATLLGAIPALIRALAGTGVWWQKGLSFVTIIGLYTFGGITGGVVVGLLRGLTKWWWGRRLIGMIASVPFMFAVAITVVGIRDWTPKDVRVWLLSAAVWGLIMSFIFEDDAKVNWPRVRSRPGQRRRW